MWSLWWYLSHAIPSTPTLAPSSFVFLITTVISVMCHRGLSHRNAFAPIFTVSKEASTESCEFRQLPTAVSLPRVGERVWANLSFDFCQQMTTSVSRWRVLFFAEKTGLLRAYPGRCAEKSSKISLDGFSSLKLFKSTLTSWSTAARKRWYGSEHSCQSYTLRARGVCSYRWRERSAHHILVFSLSPLPKD